MISIDMPAGPSEVLVIADEHADPVYIAVDLLSQVIAIKKLRFFFHYNELVSALSAFFL